MPIYTPTACLSASYEQEFGGNVVNTFASARAIHQALYDDENLYRRIYASHNSPAQSVKDHLDENCNIVTAQLSLLYSEVDVDEGLPESLESYQLPVQFESDRDHVTFSMLNQYTHHNDHLTPAGPYMLRTDFNQSVLNRLALAKLAVPLDTLTVAEKKFKQTPEKILLKDFPQAFHHSEQSLMSSLLSPANIEAILNTLRRKHTATFGGVILDMYSTRYMCNNCNYQLVGFSNNGYIPALLEAINAADLNITYPDRGPFVHARVSAEYTTTTNNGSLINASNDRGVIHRYTSNEDNFLPLQSGVRKMRLTAYQGEDFATKSDFFLSGNLRNNEVDTAIIHKRNTGLR